MIAAFACRLSLVALCAATAYGQKFYTYVEDLGPTYVELAWGTADGINTIGRTSPSHGTAIIKIAGQTISSKLNFATIGNLQPDHEYTYEITIGKTPVGNGQVRTWAAQADKLAFFVIGDYGTGTKVQYDVAQAMWQEFQRRMKTGYPARFMLSTGDNIYGSLSSFIFGVGHTGKDDFDWAQKFFEPYQPLIARIPFFGTLGNHDGNETEHHADLPAFLDNFPFPGDKPGRYYSFTYGNLAEFFGLDSTRNTEKGPPRPSYLENGAQFRWMQQEFAKPKPLWVIPYYHHPVFNAGPLHAPSMRDLAHWVRLFAASGVKVVFNGHEHNFQMSEANDASSGIRFITSGAGGELRSGSVRGNMQRANIAAWAPQNHFLAVEIEGKTMRVMPLSFGPVNVQDSNGAPVPLPIVITLP
ncbi:MAG: metallophosphoesterase [Bryobacteraceae bacterium]